MSQIIHPMFVYGTLLSGESAHALIAPHVEYTHAAVLPNAVLFSLGAYPMLVSGDGQVRGEVYWLAQSAYQTLLETLDRYEGPQYARRLLPVQLEGSTDETAAWVYVGQEMPVHAMTLSGGDWRQRDLAENS